MLDETESDANEPITVIILSRNRPLYLWACLDSLYRYTRHPARFILVDNQSDDPMVPRVITGFERRGMFTTVERHATNSSRRVFEAIVAHQRSPSDYMVIIESDVVVFDTEPCWLSRMRALMDAHPQLGILGSYVDTRDFVAPETARRLDPNLDEQILMALIKGRSQERRLLPTPLPEPLIDPFNPPGRFAMIRKQIIGLVPFTTDGNLYKKIKGAGIGAAIATQVRHRHLSLLNFFDYPDYDLAARDAFVDANRREPILHDRMEGS